MMQHQEIVDALKAVSLFSALSPRFLNGIAKSCTERDFETDAALIRQGNAGIGVFVIVSGKVKIVKTNDKGERLELATHGAGEVIGEMSVLDGALRTADVIALEPTKCLVLSAWDFKSFMESHPEVALEILPVVVRRFRETNEALTGH
ncbi:MAG: cyclic nucleotide-binding domain-containing protein [Spirochaetales bacterium]|nr:MAG: cyclic nucleotide-binding domain-containing protein [Spirochaetales bacterium]